MASSAGAGGWVRGGRLQPAGHPAQADAMRNARREPREPRPHPLAQALRTQGAERVRDTGGERQ